MINGMEGRWPAVGSDVASGICPDVHHLPASRPHVTFHRSMCHLEVRAGQGQCQISKAESEARQGTDTRGLAKRKRCRIAKRERDVSCGKRMTCQTEEKRKQSIGGEVRYQRVHLTLGQGPPSESQSGGIKRQKKKKEKKKERA